MLDSGIPDRLGNLPARKWGILQGGVEPELATSSREGPSGHGVTLSGVIFRVAARAKKSHALDVGYVVGEVREVDSRVLPFALLADRTEQGDQIRPQASVLCAVPASNLRPKHDPYRNLQSRSYALTLRVYVITAEFENHPLSVAFSQGVDGRRARVPGS